MKTIKEISDKYRLLYSILSIFSAEVGLTKEEEDQFLKKTFSTIKSQINLINEVIRLFSDIDIDFIYLLENEDYSTYPADNIIDAKSYIVDYLLYKVFPKEKLLDILLKFKNFVYEPKYSSFIDVVQYDGTRKTLMCDKSFFKIKNKSGLYEILECVNITLIYNENRKLTNLAIAEKNILFFREIFLDECLKISIKTQNHGKIDRWQPIYKL